MYFESCNDVGAIKALYTGINIRHLLKKSGHRPTHPALKRGDQTPFSSPEQTQNYLCVIDRLRILHPRNRRPSAEHHLTLASCMRVISNEVLWEALLERYDAFKVLNLLIRELDLQCLKVVVKMLDFAAADYWEDIGC